MMGLVQQRKAASDYYTGALPIELPPEVAPAVAGKATEAEDENRRGRNDSYPHYQSSTETLVGRGGLEPPTYCSIEVTDTFTTALA